MNEAICLTGSQLCLNLLFMQVMFTKWKYNANTMISSHPSVTTGLSLLCFRSIYKRSARHVGLTDGFYKSSQNLDSCPA